MVDVAHYLCYLCHWYIHSNAANPLFIAYWDRNMVFNATFNKISVISWRSVLWVEETGIHGENYRPAAGY